MSTLVHTLQEIVRHELRRLRICELGLVEAVYPHSGADDDDNYGCDVRLKNSGLLLKRVPVLTGHVGSVAIPNVGDLVLLAFDKGDVNQPVVLGRLYNETARPPLNNPDELIFRLPLAAADDKTVMAAIRNLEGSDPPREVLVEMPPKITLRISDGTVRATAGRTEMELDQPDGGGGTVTVFAGRTQITLDQDGDVTVRAAGSMTIAADGDLSLQATNVKIEGRANASVEAGAQATLKGNATATVQGGGSTSVKGAMVSIQGQTSFSP